jgi:hypothetical protein
LHDGQLVGGHHPDGLGDRDAPVGLRRGGDGQANTVDPARDGPAHPGRQSQLDPLGYNRWGRDKRNSVKHMAGRGSEAAVVVDHRRRRSRLGMTVLVMTPREGRRSVEVGEARATVDAAA